MARLRVSLGFIEASLKLPPRCWISGAKVIDDRHIEVQIEGSDFAEDELVSAITTIETKLVKA